MVKQKMTETSCKTTMVNQVVWTLQKDTQNMKTRPHRMFLDMILAYQVYDPVKIAFHPVTQNDCEKENLTESDLFAYAKENTFSLLPSVIRTQDCGGGVRFTIITNRQTYYGATAMLDETVRTELQKTYPDGFFILPSSVHEFFAVPKDTDPLRLKAFVMGANRTDEIVLENEVLSDSVYEIEADGSFHIW